MEQEAIPSIHRDSPGARGLLSEQIDHRCPIPHSKAKILKFTEVRS